MITRGCSTAGTTDISATGTIGEVAEISTFTAARPGNVATAGPSYITAARTRDVVATRGWQFAEGLPAAGWSLKGGIAATWAGHRRSVTGEATAAGATTATSSANVSAAASASASTAAESAAATTAACEQVVRNPSSDCGQANR